MLTQELIEEKRYKTESKERLSIALQRMLSTSSADEKIDIVKSLTESYHKYKREYVKHLSFNPEEENLSKYSNFRNYAPPLDVKGGIIAEKVVPVFSESSFLACFGLVM